MSIVANKTLVVFGTFIFAAAIILREHFYGGVITHHLLASEDMPGFSNWWGLVTVPLLAWICITLIQRRRDITTKVASNPKAFEAKALKRFLAALVFGLALSVLWELDLESILQYLIGLPMLIAIVWPVYLPEYFLGFVLGMLYTFGGILPIIIGLVLLILCFLIYQLIRILRNAFSPNANK